MTEPDLEAMLRAEGLEPSSWSNGPGDRYGVHRHPYDKVIVVERGSITFGLPAGGERVALARGDRLELPADTEHDALVGPGGVTCLESHLPPGTLSSRRARRIPAFDESRTVRSGEA